MLHSETQSEKDSLPLSHAETDALLQKVEEQIALNTFDTSDNELLKVMVESLGDTRGMVRLGFAEALGKVGKPATPFLIEALANHQNPVVRRASAKTLTLIADPSSIPNLIHALLNDEDTVVKGSSVGALAKMGGAAVPVLLEILASPETPESTKGHIAWALAFIGVEAKEQLYGAISSELSEVRSAIVGAISSIAEQEPEERAFQLLIKSLNDPASSVRSEAASALGKLAYQPAIPNLVELLTHIEAESRKAAALALMKIGDRSALAPLQNALTKESEEGVHKAIKLAISLIEKKSEEDDWD
ncbi:MAG: HEAT repeat domain-containing protein [Moorea sp. SIO2B7]|nr:HEAT repeat domain-containing protein [Moorena sp. SIO2B7]